jgi:hypothetical protein
VTSATWGWNETDWRTIEFYGERGCTIDVSNIALPSHFTGETISSTSVRFKPTGNNESENEYDETATVTIGTGSESCSKTVSLYQYNRGVTCTTIDCNCYEYNNASIDESSLTCDSTSATLSFDYIQYNIVRTEDCVVTKTEKSRGTTSTTVTFTSNAGGRTDVPRSGNFIWSNHKVCGDGVCGSNDVSIPWNLTLPACTCTTSSCTCYMVGAATANTVSSEATSATITWPYSAITWSTASTCDISSAKTEGTSSTTVTFEAATCDDYTKDGSFAWIGHKVCSDDGCSNSDVIINWTVEQTRPAVCDCSCDDMTISPTSLVWEGDNTDAKTIEINSADCITNISIGSLSHFTATIGNNVISVVPNEPNIEASDIDENMVITYKAYKTDCSKTVTLKHKLQECCDNLVITQVDSL